MARPRGKSTILIKEDHAEIVCKHANFIIDLDDVSKVSAFKWFSKSSISGYYAYAHDTEFTPKVLLHRIIVGAIGLQLVDHKNRNTLDNRKSNLRICSRAENNRNAKKNKRGKSRYKGVTLRPSGNFGVYIQSKCVGTYPTEEEAALAYNEKALQLFGEYANINIIGENYDD